MLQLGVTSQPTFAHHAIVANSTHLSFFLNGEIMGIRKLPRLITDCAESEQVFLGEKGMTINGLRFSTRVLSSTDVRELYDQGMTMNRIAAGASVVVLPPIGKTEALTSELENVSSFLDDKLDRSLLASEYVMAAYMANRKQGPLLYPSSIVEGAIPVLLPLDSSVRRPSDGGGTDYALFVHPDKYVSAGGLNEVEFKALGDQNVSKATHLINGGSGAFRPSRTGYASINIFLAK